MRFEGFLKKITSGKFRRFVCATLSAVLLVGSLSLYVLAGGTGQTRNTYLGTAVAVGSPILNPDFSTDNWNPYEMEVWGIYLSNFVRPLQDTYESAFTNGGPGVTALEIGSGNNPDSNAYLKVLLNYAVTTQKQSLSDLYVGFVADGGSANQIYSSPDSANSTGVFAHAHLYDLYCCGLIVGCDDGVLQYSDDKKFVDGTTHGNSAADSVLNYDLFLQDYHVVFFKEVKGEKKVMFDTSSRYDIDMLNSMLVMYGYSNSAFGDAFIANRDGVIRCDPFGNFVLNDGTMVFPAACNSHFLAGGVHNYLNSVVVNGFTSVADPCVNGKGPNDTASAYFRGLADTSWRNNILNESFPCSYDGKVHGCFYQNSMDWYFTSEGQSFLNEHPAESTWQATRAIAESSVGDGNLVVPVRFAVPVPLTGCQKIGETKISSLLSNGNFIWCIAPQINNGMVGYHVWNSEDLTARAVDEIVYPNGGTTNLFTTIDDGCFRLTDSQVWIADGVGPDGIDDDGFNTADATNLMFGLSARAYVRAMRGETLQGVDSSRAAYYDALMSTGNGDYCWGDDMGDIKFEYMGAITGSKKGVTWYASQYNGGNNSSRGDVPQSYHTMWKCFWFDDNTSASIRSMASCFGGTQYGAFGEACAELYVSYLSAFGIGKDQDSYGTAISISDFDENFFSAGVLLQDQTVFNGAGAGETDADKLGRLRNNLNLYMDPKAGAEYRASLMTNQFKEWCYSLYSSLVGRDEGKQSSSAGGFLLPSVAESPLLSFILNHWFVVFCVVLLIVIGFSIYSAGVNHKAWYWVVISVAFSGVLLVIIPNLARGTILGVNSAGGALLAPDMSLWVAEEVVDIRALEVGAVDNYGDDADSQLEATGNLDMMLRSDAVQTIRIDQDIFSKHNVTVEGIYKDVAMGNYLSAMWVVPALLNSRTKVDDKGNYSADKGFYTLMSECETIYWQYHPENVFDSYTISSLSAMGSSVGSSLVDTTFDYSAGAGSTNVHWHSISGVISGVDGIHNSTAMFDEDLCTDTFAHSSYVFSGDVSGIIAAKKDDERTKLIEDYFYNCAVSSVNSFGGDDVVARAASFDIHTVREDNGGFYLTGTETVYPYFYCVLQDTFSGFNTTQMYDAIIGKETSDSPIPLSFVNATTGGDYIVFSNTGSTVGEDHVWDANAVAVDKHRDVLDLDYFFRYYAPEMYAINLMYAGTYDQDGVYSEDDLLGEAYPLLNDRSKAWLMSSNWTIKLYENPSFTKPAVVNSPSLGAVDVVPIMPWTYPDDRPFIVCRAQMEAYGLTERELTAVEILAVNANDNAADEIIRGVNLYQTSLDRNAFIGTIALGCMTDFNSAFNVGSGLFSSQYTLMPDTVPCVSLGFDRGFSGIMYGASPVVSGMPETAVYNSILNGDVIFDLLVVIVALIGCKIVPLLRLKTLIVYILLATWVIIYHCEGGFKLRLGICFSMVMMFGAFALLNIGHLAIIGYFIRSASGTLLSGGAMTGLGGWLTILVLLIVYGLYIFLNIRLLAFYIRNRNDLGFEYGKVFMENIHTQGVMRTLGGFATSFAKGSKGGFGSARDLQNDIKNEQGATDATVGEQLGGNNSSSNTGSGGSDQVGGSGGGSDPVGTGIAAGATGAAAVEIARASDADVDFDQARREAEVLGDVDGGGVTSSEIRDRMQAGQVAQDTLVDNNSMSGGVSSAGVADRSVGGTPMSGIGSAGVEDTTPGGMPLSGTAPISVVDKTDSSSGSGVASAVGGVASSVGSAVKTGANAVGGGVRTVAHAVTGDVAGAVQAASDTVAPKSEPPKGPAKDTLVDH